MKSQIATIVGSFPSAGRERGSVGFVLAVVAVCFALAVAGAPSGVSADSGEDDGGATQQATTPKVPEDGEAILERVDRELTAVEDLRASTQLTIEDASGSTKERTLTVMQKGDDKRFIQLTDPARLRGVGLLAKGDDQNYLYLPAMRRVRRIAGADRGEPFLDSDFTNDDLMRTTFSSRFEPEISDDDATVWTLVLSPREPDDEPYSSLQMKVRKEDYQIAEILFYEDGAQEATRRLTSGNFEAVESQIVAHQFVAEDLRSGSRSELVLSDVEVNIGLEDSQFTRRQLQR